MIQINLSALTDTGVVRDHNEDNFIVSPDLSKDNWFLTDKTVSLSSKGSLLIVADGMGGTNAGEVASAIAVESVKKFFSSIKIQEAPSESKAKEILRKSIVQAHDEIVKHAATNPAYQGMGTTIILAWIIDDQAIIAWCGDSRGYLYRSGEGIKIITKDHSLVWELVKSGRLTPEEADQHPDNNIITQSLGDHHSSPKPDFVVQQLLSKDILLLCSDGLNNMISTEKIGLIVSQEKPLAKINKELIEAANQSGGHDNITAVLLQVASGSDMVQQKQERSGVKVLFILLLLSMAVGIGGYYLYEKNQKTSMAVSEEGINLAAEDTTYSVHATLTTDSVSVPALVKPIKKDSASGTLAVPDTPIVSNKKENNSVDSLAQVALRIKKIESLLEDWKKTALVLDSIQQHQSRKNIDTLKTAFLFDLINRQREFEEAIEKYRFTEKVENWKAKDNAKSVKVMNSYNTKKLDEEIESVKSKFDTIQKILNKVTGKV